MAQPADARRYHALPSPFAMKRGGVLHGAHVAYETWGELSAARRRLTRRLPRGGR